MAQDAKFIDEAAYAKFREVAPKLGLHPSFLRDEQSLRALFAFFSQGKPLPVEETLEALARATNQVCSLVSTAQNVRLGTGFLVGEDRVLTASHVLPARAEAMVCSFNNIVFTDNEVITKDLTEVEVGRVVFVSQEDGGGVSAGHLDFALLELKKKIGGPPRGFVSLQKNRIDLNDSVYIVDHPGGGPTVVFSGGNVTKPFNNVSDLVFVHSASAADGSSGAPVFDNQFDLIGMHRAPQEAVSSSQIITELGRNGVPI